MGKTQRMLPAKVDLAVGVFRGVFCCGGVSCLCLFKKEVDS